MADQAAAPNIGNETFIEFCARPEWAAQYGNPDGDDTFLSLNTCTNAVWARAVRDTLKQINEAFACRHPTPLGTKASATSDNDWRPSDDDSFAIQGGDFGAAGVLVPQYFFHLNADTSNQIAGGTSLDIEQGETSGQRIYSYVRVQGRPGINIGSSLVGMRTFSGAVGHSLTYDSTLALATEMFASITVRVPEWPQANERIVLLAVKRRNSEDETGGVDRLNFEFGLGPSATGVFPPSSDDKSYSLYVRWRDSSDIENLVINEVPDPVTTFDHGVGITPGYEWALGFHRYFEGAGFRIDFYVNGQLVSTRIDFSTPAPGSSTDIRLMVGGGSLQKKIAGGPMRNVSIGLGVITPATVAAHMQFLYQKGAGYI